MLVSNMLNRLQAVKRVVLHSRNLGSMAPAMAKATDPIQQLFVDKVREYKQKSPTGKFVDPTPEIEKELAAELEKLAKIYSSDGKSDMTQFPTLKFEEPKLDSINE